MLDSHGVDDLPAPRAPGDTNAEVLPAKKTKAKVQKEVEEEKPMSKRKRRKLEQLAQKNASKEVRAEVLEQLKAVKLTPDQAELLKASQSTRLSKREQKAMAQRRAQLGIPLTSDMKETLRRRPRQLKPKVENDEELSEEQEQHGEKPETGNIVQLSMDAPKPQAQPKPEMKASKKLAPKKTSQVEAMATQPLQRVHVERTADIEEQRTRLPAVMMEQEFVEMLLSNDVMLVCGDTGCGKSTQVPQFLYECGICNGKDFLIGVTQPRRVAAISVSQRVGQELNESGKVGYQVRYDRSNCTEDMRIKFMTDGILLREVQADFLCRKYTAIVIDEAHERGVNCDILIGLLSRAVHQRRKAFQEAVAAGRFNKDPGTARSADEPPPPLKLVIMSATLRLCDFTENQQLFPVPPPVLRIDARTFPVTVHFERRTEEDYIKAAHRSVWKIHKDLPPGSILVFVTGRQEVHRLCRMLQQTQLLTFNSGKALEEAAAEVAEQEGKTADLDLEASDDEGNLSEPELEEGNEGKIGDAGRLKKKLKGKRKKKALDTSGDVKVEGVADSIKPGAKRKRTNEKEEATQDIPDEMPELSFAVGEEDVVVLEGEAATAAEDAKDIELRNQRKVRMSRLDKSRTAGGVFKGVGFGEGQMRVLPLYAQLSATKQLEPFKHPPENQRVVVISTNVAETSVTLPNVRYVVDCGREKRRRYKASSGASAFAIDRISKASADQRAGRAGRLGPGHSYRLYSSAAYENYFPKFAPLQMLHTPMDPVLLLLAFLGVPRLDVFPWPTPPPAEAISAAIRRLRAIGAIEDDGTRAEGSKATAAVVKCTTLGYRLAALPVAPRYARMLLAAVSTSADLKADHIIGHACAIVAALSVGNLTCWESAQEVEGAGPGGLENELVRAQREAQRRLDEATKKEAPKWSQLRDDAEGLLWLMGGYAWAARGGDEAAEAFCQKNKINPRQMAEAHSLMQQLAELLQRRLCLSSAGFELQLPLLPRPPTPRQVQLLRECIAEGLLDRVAIASPDLGHRAYICADLGRERPVYIHTASNAFRHRPHPSVLVFNEIISTHKPFMRDCINVDPLHLAKVPLLFIPVPGPRYLPEQDKVLAFASPSYIPLSYALPTVEVEVPANSIFRYKVFAKALLEGMVVRDLPAQDKLLAKPTLLLHAPTNPRVSALVSPLWQFKVGSRGELYSRWKHDSRFLLEGYLKWVPNTAHDDVRMAWPPM
ncbi:unnamed protein product [Durusdinium trenchii]|uniref:Uncharacterized protein n=1 Tax=Durusdinium trenchii TaxID=1381693 RepID=A0ABP0LBI4_9DINO